MRSDNSYKGPFECNDEDVVVDKLDVEEEASSVNSDKEAEHTEFIESSEIESMDIESHISSSSTSFLTTHLEFSANSLSISITPFTFISRKIWFPFWPIMCQGNISSVIKWDLICI